MSSAAVKRNNRGERYGNDDFAMTSAGNNGETDTINNNNDDDDDDSNDRSQQNNVITPQPKRNSSSSSNNNKRRNKQRAKIIASTKTSLDRRMAVEKNVVDELLLVCGVIGTTTSTTTTRNGTEHELVPVTDCLNWLQDLQRALRRDEDLYRPISLLLGKWKIVEQKLLPLVVTCRYDTPIVLTVLKILVILTKPLAENTQRAGQMVIDTSSPKSDPAVVAQQIKLRENAVAQAEQLMDYKRIVTFHASHLQNNSMHAKHTNNNNKTTKTNKRKPGTGLLSVFVSLLAEPLSRSGASRTDADHLTIELVLHLIRNLLSAQPILNTSPETSRQAAQLHQDMITLFERELVLEILLVVGQEMELRENAQYNLLMMEILHHVVKAQDPTAVAHSVRETGTPSGAIANATVSASASGAPGRNRLTGTKHGASASSSSALASKLKQEKAQRQTLKSVRHGHFSGTWMRRQADGKRQFVGAASVVNGNGGSAQTSGGRARRTNRLAEPFIGSGKTLLAHTRSPVQLCGAAGGPAAKRANRTLNEFCRRFVEDCYGPFMKSIKNEFRRDSQRLEEKDKIVFFKLVWFFAQWSRVSSSSSASRRDGNKGNNNNSNNEAIGRLIITMDVFTFNLVLTATETFYQQKKHTRLAQAVALYAEMMHLLHSMYTSKDKTEHEMAMGLIDRLFYHGQDALDQLPKLLSRWSPGTYTREYLCDLVEVAHVSLKLLEANTKKGIEFLTKGAAGGTETTKFSHKIAKMRKDAAEFDVKQYFVRKIVSNQLVSMYGYLLDQYKVNAAVVNHRIITMFLRVMRLEIATPDVADADTAISPLGTRRVTLEPMLYNLQLIMVMERILNDVSIQKDKAFEPVINFCTGLLYKFWSAADSNPMLYVECLFQHAMPHRFCESVTNMYVTDELRMMAEREILREDQLREQMEYGADGDGAALNARLNDDDDDDDDEAEHEFTGDTVSQSSPNAKRTDDENEDSEPANEENQSAGAQDGTSGSENQKDSMVSKKRKKEPDDDSSDDEGIFGSTNEEAQPITKRRKNVLDDDSDDDDEEDDDGSTMPKK